MKIDKDLHSIQTVRDLIRDANNAQNAFARFDPEKVNRILSAIADDCMSNAKKLAKMAVEETGFGIWQDKVLKNKLGSAMTYDYIRNMKTTGILNEDKERGLIEIGVPMGVVAAIIPSTNPTSTVIYKVLISLKAGNGIVISPHPKAKNCILEAVRIMKEAASRAGAPDGLIGCMENVNLDAIHTLMKHRDIGIILATGGEAMVRAAYSSGNPALGVGPGNGPAYIESSADIPLSVKRIFDSKTFDNGTICASEQSIVTDECIESEVAAQIKRQGGYFLNEEESKKISKLLLRSNGTMNPAIVGKSAQYIAQLGGISIPENTRVLLSRQTNVGKSNPYSREKLCPVLGYYVEKNWESACALCIEILKNEGIGHTMTIHTKNDDIVREFAIYKPISRLLVNTPGALGGVGVTTNLPPALTLGCGAIGKSASSENISPMNLINIRYVAYGTRELETLRQEKQASDLPSDLTHGITRKQIEEITQEVLGRLSHIS